MNAVILAAGFGSRLGEQTKTAPKALLSLGYGCVLDGVLSSIDRDQIHAFHIVHATRWNAAFKKWKSNCNVRKYIKLYSNGVIEEQQRRGSVGDLNFVVKRFTKRESIIVAFADNVFKAAKLGQLIGDGPAITVRKLESLSSALRNAGFGRVQLDGDHVKEITTTGGDLVFAGPIYLDKGALLFLDEFCKGEKLPDDLGKFVSHLAKRSRVRVVLNEDRFFDIGTPAGLYEARAFFREARW